MEVVCGKCGGLHVVQYHRIGGIDLDDCIDSNLLYILEGSGIVQQQRGVKLKDVIGRVEPIDRLFADRNWVWAFAECDRIAARAEVDQIVGPSKDVVGTV